MNYLNCISQELQSCESFSECDWYLMVDVKINKYSEGQGVICFVCALVPGASQFLEQISTRVLEKLRCCNLSAARKPFYCYPLCSRLLWCCGAVALWCCCRKYQPQVPLCWTPTPTPPQQQRWSLFSIFTIWNIRVISSWYLVYLFSADAMGANWNVIEDNMSMME